MKYRFKAKDLKTGEWVIGDLAYSNSMYFNKRECSWKIGKTKPMIVEHNISGGMLWISKRCFIDENTLELIINDTENQI